MQLSMAWERWRELASKKFDFNLTFQTSAAQALEKMLCAQEQGPLKVSHIPWALRCLNRCGN